MNTKLSDQIYSIDFPEIYSGVIFYRVSVSLRLIYADFTAEMWEI
jgi:hypothetical protein